MCLCVCERERELERDRVRVYVRACVLVWLVGIKWALGGYCVGTRSMPALVVVWCLNFLGAERVKLVCRFM